MSQHPFRMHMQEKKYVPGICGEKRLGKGFKSLVDILASGLVCRGTRQRPAKRFPRCNCEP
jgi:hypothetical protein